MLPSQSNNRKVKVIARLEEAILESVNEFRKDADTYKRNTLGANIHANYVSYMSKKSFSKLAQAISDLAPKQSIYYRRAISIPYVPNWGNAEELRGIAENLKEDYEKDYLFNIEETIAESIFTDILEQAKFLLSEKLVRASAIIAGVALESHIRKLATKNNIPITKDDGKYVRSEKLNEDLKGASIYDTTYLKHVSAWLDLRNKAAHPDDPEIDKKGDLVEAMISGIGNFILKFPA